MKPIGLILGLISLILILFGVLHLVSNKKPYYLPEGFTSEAIDTEPVKYPTENFNNIKNPVIKTLKKLLKISSFLVNPAIWRDTMKLSNTSFKKLAIENLNKEKLLAQLKNSTTK